ncbi:unnamed protein product [Cuscuta campestris]|uniref:Uncharacterized protein n=1 Tax=Cuscuta campestris TaxID=132261 RepID=A0A484MW60_9ASTE|nr:unnamed protein product [Cuscuta campestris]
MLIELNKGIRGRLHLKESYINYSVIRIQLIEVTRVEMLHSTSRIMAMLTAQSETARYKLINLTSNKRDTVVLPKTGLVVTKNVR